MSQWTAELRIARRDALRARGRSALIAAMVAIPVLGMTAIDVLARSAQLDTDERITWELGAADALVYSAGHHAVAQSPDGDGYSHREPVERGAATPPPAPTDPRALLPAGSRVLTSQTTSVVVRTVGGVARTQLEELAYDDPMLAGLFVQVSGRAPQRPGEVVTSPALLKRTGLEVGDTLRLTDPAAEATVVGVARRRGELTGDAIVAAPGLLPRTAWGDQASRQLYVDTPGPLSWPQVMALNEKGVVAVSRSVLLDPPPRADVPYYQQDVGGSSNDALFVGILMALVGSVAGLEVVLLAGAAFAVGARRQARSLAVVAASGGEARHARSIVLAGGLVLGATGGIAGVVLGIGLTRLSLPLLQRLTGTELGRFDVRPVEVLAIASLGVVVGVVAAVLPARAASRMDVVAALAGRRGAVRTPRRVPVIGVLVVAAGIAASVVGSGLALALSTGERAATDTLRTVAATLIAGGAGLTMLGLIVTSPAIVGAAGRLGHFLPLTPRLALRDASRNRSRSAPAVAAILAGVTGATALSIYVAAMDDSDRRRYTPTLPVGTATVQLAMWDPQGTARSTADPAMIRRLVSAEMPVAASAVLRSLDESCPDPASGCRQVRLVAPPGLACPWDAPESEPRVETSAQVPAECTGPTATWSSAPHLVGDVTTLRQLGVPVTEAAQRALASGGVVSFAERFLAEGRITVETSPLEEDAAGDVRPTTLPGAYVDTPMPPATALFSPEAAERIGMDVQSDALFLRLDRPPTSQEEDAARAAVQNAGLDEYNFYVERGYVSEYGLGLLALVIGSAIVTLGATGVVTGLAQADSRPDYATLAAVGATPRMRRKLATCQAAVVAGLGTVLGMAAGFVPAIAFINADTQLNLILPWRNLLIVLVGLPLMAALLAGLMVRSRLPLERRLAA